MGRPTFKTRNTIRAKALRNAATPAERRLWAALRNGQVGGCKFSRQMPIGPYFADFLCRQKSLIIEVDGDSHDFTYQADTRRTDWLEEMGFRVLRFTNAEVMQDIDGVVIVIGDALAELSDAHPQPLPQAGGEVSAS